MKKSKKLRKLQKSAKMGNAPAMYRLGLCYEKGILVAADPELAAEWIALATFADYPPAIQWMKEHGGTED